MVRKIIIQIFIICIFMMPQRIYASDVDSTTDELVWEIISMGEYDKIDSYTNQLFPTKISFMELVQKIINGENNIASYFCEYVFDFAFYEISSIKYTIISMLSLIIVFALLNKISAGRDNYINDVSFFMIYAALMTMLLGAFELIGKTVNDGMNNIMNFLSAIIPAYATTLVLTGNVSSAGYFYTLTFALIYLMEFSLKYIFVPGIQIYVLFVLLNNIYIDKQFSKLASMIYRGIRIGLRTCVAIVAGIGVIQSMINTAKDKVNDSVILRTFSLIPGIGKVTGASGEIFLSCAMLVKNSVGVALLIILLAITVIPLVKVFIFQITYKLIAAVVQPIADQRIVDGIHGIASAGELYVSLLIDAMLLFFITIATVCVTSNFST